MALKSSSRGKLIVIDGSDGSGKKTQFQFLARRLRKDGHIVKLVDFPEYYKNFFGKFIGHCLSEQYYNWLYIHPKIASIAYAADRFESKAKLEDWLKKGHVVIANRYVSSNQIHQGGKISDSRKRKKFIEWLDEMEYGVFKIPKPNITFYLDVPVPVVEKLIAERKERRRYLGKDTRDVHEKNKNFLSNSRKSALWLAKTQKGWVKIDCVKNGKLDTRENIHEQIYNEVKKILR